MSVGTGFAIAGWVAAIVAIVAALSSARGARRARRSADIADRQALAAEVTRRQVGEAEQNQKTALAQMAENVRHHQLRRLEDNYTSRQKLLSAVKSILRTADQFFDLRAQEDHQQWHDTFIGEMAVLIPKMYDVQLQAHTEELLKAIENTLINSYQMLDAVKRMQRGDDANAVSTDYLASLELLRKVSSDLEQHATAASARAQAYDPQGRSDEPAKPSRLRS